LLTTAFRLSAALFAGGLYLATISSTSLLVIPLIWLRITSAFSLLRMPEIAESEVRLVLPPFNMSATAGYFSIKADTLILLTSLPSEYPRYLTR
jgi:hypothetical protein